MASFKLFTKKNWNIDGIARDCSWQTLGIRGRQSLTYIRLIPYIPNNHLESCLKSYWNPVQILEHWSYVLLVTHTARRQEAAFCTSYSFWIVFKGSHSLGYIACLFLMRQACENPGLTSKNSEV